MNAILCSDCSSHKSPILFKWFLGLVAFLGLFQAVDCVLGQSQPPSSGLVAWWKGDGNAMDSSGHGHDGTLLNGAGYGTGLFGQAFSLGPGFNRVLVSDSTDFNLTNGLSIGAWVYPTGNSWYVVAHASFEYVPYSLGMDDAGHIGLVLASATGNVDNLSTNITYNTWTQVTATWDGTSGTMSLYFNGALVAQKITTLQPGGQVSNNQPGLCIGNEPTGGFPFQGLIEQVVLYSRALSPAEVATLAGAAPTIITQPQSQNVYSGTTATLSVLAAGSPLNYQWYKNGQPLTGQTNSSLVFTNVSTTDQGTYAVVVSNPSTLLASTSAQLSVTDLNSSIGLYPGITIGGISNSTVQIQYSVDIGPNPKWTTLTNLTLTSPVEFWLDMTANLNSANPRQRFYRVVPGP